ncbi:MAG: TolC family protein [Kiritimatiellae bacterium]|nr:TolC family protein [Kiritimatiellia bacterium]
MIIGGFLGGCLAFAASCTHPTADQSAGPDVRELHRDFQERMERCGRDAIEPSDDTAHEYQSDDTLLSERDRANTAGSRQEACAWIAQRRALTLPDCLALSLEFNDGVRAQRAELKAMHGERLIAQSRFVPGSDYGYERTAIDGNGGLSTNRTAHYVQMTQRILEFGRENPVSVTLRANERAALFDYENKAAEVLSQVRTVFFTVLLRLDQRRERLMLLNEFEAKLKRVERLEEERRVVEVDVLTARLNVLNEKARINVLDQEIKRQQLELLRLLGLPLRTEGLELAGAVEAFALPVDDSVGIAQRRSTSIALARAEVGERMRLVREAFWEAWPDITLRAAMKEQDETLGLALNGEQGAYSLSAFGRHDLEATEESLRLADDPLTGEESGWFVRAGVSLPFFDGVARELGARQRDRERLAAARLALRGTIEATELAVRQAYATLHERRGELEIARERVDISKERLRIKERLKELGKITDDELETFRALYFSDQDAFFDGQIATVAAQESLRREMRFFAPQPERNAP